MAHSFVKWRLTNNVANHLLKISPKLIDLSCFTCFTLIGTTRDMKISHLSVLVWTNNGSASFSKLYCKSLMLWFLGSFVSGHSYLYQQKMQNVRAFLRKLSAVIDYFLQIAKAVWFCCSCLIFSLFSTSHGLSFAHLCNKGSWSQEVVFVMRKLMLISGSSHVHSLCLISASGVEGTTHHYRLWMESIVL